MTANPPPTDAAPGPLFSFWAGVPRLDASLRSAGLQTTPDVWIRVESLLLQLAAEGQLADLAALRPVLAPLFCRSAADQVHFERLYANWASHPQTTPPPPAVEKAKAATEHTDAQVRRLGRLAWRPVAVGLLLLTFAVAVAPRFSPEDPIKAPPPAKPLPNSNEGPTTLPDDAWQQIPLQPLGPRPLTGTPEAVPNARNQALLDRLETIVPLAGLPLVVLWIGVRWWRRRAIVARVKGARVLADNRRITFADAQDLMFDSATVRGAMRQLHRPIAWPTGQLDTTRSVLATIAQAGHFVPVYGQRLALPTLLLLVERRRPGDQLNAVADSFQGRLRAAGVHVERFDYERDPRTVMSIGGAAPRYVTLDELARRYGRARLLIIGDPAPFMDIWHKCTQPWVDALLAWPQRALLVTRSAEPEWDDVLSGSGLTVAPFSSSGLVQAGMALGQAFGMVLAQAEGGAGPPLAASRIRAWQEHVSKANAEDSVARAMRALQPLLAELRQHLGGSGFTLLAAMAVWPELHWGLTRILDLSLFPGPASAARERRLMTLAGLPWCRDGVLPDALRRGLLRSLAGETLKDVRGVYLEILERAVVDGEGGIQLPVDIPARARDRVDVAAEVLDASALGRDPIFRQFVLGRLQDELGVELPVWLARLIPGERIPRVGWPAALTAVGLLVVALACPLVWHAVGRQTLTDVLLTTQAAELAGWTIEITSGADMDDYFVALRTRLTAIGYGSVEPGASAPPGDVPAANLIEYAPGEANAAARLANAVTPVLWGRAPAVREAGGISPGHLRIVLTERPGSGTPLPADLDRFRNPFDAAAWADVARRIKSGEYASTWTPAPRTRLLRRQAEFEPLLMALPGGEFEMGCSSASDECFDDEKPRHTVRIAPFAIGVNEVTFAEYDVFARDTNRKLPDDRGWGRDQRPVINVSWDDARDYVAWLRDRTGQGWRLPTESEWEYAARAGTVTARFWGDDPSLACAWANVDDGSHGCSDGFEYTAPVGSFDANPFGLHDVLGNVWEWTEDCSSANYSDAPVDGRAVEQPGCTARVLRGGSWNNVPRFVRSANRYRSAPGDADGDVGFRVARTL